MTDSAATHYARSVVGGTIVAGPHVRAACKRHLQDIAREDIYWDPDAEKRILVFFEQVLVLSSGRFEGQPFVLLPWQKFVLTSLFAWKREDGTRRFRTAYIETAKGSGKTPLIAGVGLFSICADRELRAETYVIARTAEQTLPTFRDATAMVEASPMLRQRLMVAGGLDAPYNIADHRSMSFMRRVSAERKGKGKSGPKPHVVLCDEYHEQDTDDMLNVFDAGKKHRRQPLTVITTNAGAGKETPCGIEHDHAVEVAHGDKVDDRYFSFVCALDDGDRPFEDESCWIKANPSLPLIPGLDIIREQVAKARAMPSKRSLVERLYFCVWVDSEAPWIDRDAWIGCERAKPFSRSKLKEAPCYLAIDLGLRTDFSAAAMAWALPEGKIAARLKIWTPGDLIAERAEADRAPYPLWAEKGYIELVPGKTMRLSWIARWLERTTSRWNVVGLAYDRWKMDELTDTFDDVGLDYTEEERRSGLLLVRHSQGWTTGTVKADQKQKRRNRKANPEPLWMPRSIDALEDVILSKSLKVERNIALRSAALGAIVQADDQLNRRWTKKKSTTRIDAIVALCMAVGYLKARGKPKRRGSIYEKRGIRYL